MQNSGDALLLADDDIDDCSFFQDALEELSIFRPLEVVHNGQELMRFLYSINQLPGLLFLDLNMPGKNGLECLSELKRDPVLQQIPVVIISTSSQDEVINRLFELGAHFYIRKPNEFEQLKKMIERVIHMVDESVSPTRFNFVIEP